MNTCSDDKKVLHPILLLGVIDREETMKKINLMTIAIVAMATGCTSNYGITYNSEPKGAAVICEGQSKGYTPTTLNYDVKKEDKKKGTYRTVPCKAKWVSGAEQQFSNQWNLKKFPKGVTQTVQRPNVQGYQQDAEFALKVQQMQYQKQQAAAAEFSAYQQLLQNNKTTSCYTTYGVTRCY